MSVANKERIIKCVLGDPLGAKRFLSHRMRYCRSFLIGTLLKLIALEKPFDLIGGFQTKILQIIPNLMNVFLLN